MALTFYISCGLCKREAGDEAINKSSASSNKAKSCIIDIENIADMTPSQLEESASIMCKRDIVYYNFKDGHFGVLNSFGRRHPFSMAGTMQKQGPIYAFHVDEYCEQVAEMTDKGLVQLSSPKALYAPVFNRELTAYEVLKHTSLQPRFSCINLLSSAQKPQNL